MWRIGPFLRPFLRSIAFIILDVLEKKKKITKKASVPISKNEGRGAGRGWGENGQPEPEVYCQIFSFIF
jgi:hypothetical protein